MVRNPATGHAVTATGLGLHQSRVNKATSFVIETLGHSSKEFDVLISVVSIQPMKSNWFNVLQ